MTKLFYRYRIEKELFYIYRIKKAGKTEMYRRISDSDIKVMEVLWENGDVSAKEIATKLQDKVGWSKTTTYTVIKSCIKKGFIRRDDPNFVCHALKTLNEVRKNETQSLIDRIFSGSKDQLITQLVCEENLSKKDLELLRKIILSNREDKK